VRDTEEALGEIAAGMQKGRPAVVVALTGSNGKTSVKTLVTGILSRVGKTYCNPGNRNNEIGLPLAVLDAPEDAAFAVYEMGAGKPGDIAYLASIAPPQVALVNNIAPAHMERMGSLLGIAETKGAIYEALSDDGIAVINADDAFAPWFQDVVGSRRSFRFGIENDADVRASRVLAGAEGSRFLLHTPAGRRRSRCRCPACTTCATRWPPARWRWPRARRWTRSSPGCRKRRQVAGRQVAFRLDNGATVVDDSYNANPGSVAAAIATLAASGDEAWLVLGDMKELGADAEALHAQIGEQARDARLARPVDRRSARARGQRRLRRARGAFRNAGRARRCTEGSHGQGRCGATAPACEGLALERDGQGRGRAARRARGGRACCLNWRAGCRASRASSRCSTTSPCAPSWARSPRLR
jgi:UDP-N-acetylmuramoyl-tripeptide--D-alanyl-D-alanine ligase